MKKLNFGCGTDIKQSSDWVNCDIQKGKGVVSFDFSRFPYPFKDNTFDYILAREILVYFDSPQKVLLELRRISKKDAIIELEVPYYNNKGAHNDIEVKHYFSDSTFKTLVEQPYNLKKLKQFEIVSSLLNPTKVGKLMPKTLRNKLSLFLGGLISTLNVKLKVIK
jgi:SAM-dependent methyltransferase